VIKKQVLWLKISVDYSEFVNVLNARKYLVEYLAGFFLCKSAILNDVLEQLAT